MEAAQDPLEELWALAHKVTPDSDPVRAERINRGILDHQPFNKDAHLRLAKALVAQERLSEATEAWERAVSISPRSGEARQLLKIIRATYRCLSVTAEFKTFQEAFGAAKSHKVAERADAQIVCLRRALQLAAYQGDTIAATISLAAAYRSRRDRDSLHTAYLIYKSVLSKNPTNRAARNGFAALLRDLGRMVESWTTYWRSLDEDDADSYALVGLGGVLRDIGNYSGAEQVYRKALEGNPDNAFALNGLGAVLRALGKHDLADEAFRRARSLQNKAVDPSRATTESNVSQLA